MIVALPLLVLAALGIGHALFAAHHVARFAARLPQSPVAAEPVTLLKPLHGAEPRLAENLASFFDQDWPAPIQMVAGVSTPDDTAIAALAGRDIVLVVDPARHGANAKIGNLVNMRAAAAHDLIVLSDSDMVAPPTYLTQIAAALAGEGVGAVTCLYRGRGDAGAWSVLGAMGLSYAFLPNVILSLALGVGDVCMGSTIALRRGTLDRIGGFAAFADVLADDHAIGAAVRRLGLTVAVPRMVLTHASAESSLAALMRHELRWAATVRALNPAGYAGMIVTFPLPFALLALPFAPFPALAATGLALVARLWLATRIDRLCGARTAPLWLLPIRDTLSLILFLASFGVRSVDWRGMKLRMEAGGHVSAAPESPR